MTLIELLLALSGTALIGTTVAALIFAVGYGTAGDRDMRMLVVKHKVIDGRLTAAVRGATQVLDRDDGFLVLWTFDHNGDGAPNLAEIRRIEFDSDAGTLMAYQAPDTLDADDNTAYTLADDFDTITSALKGGAMFPGETWANDVAAWSNAVNSADVHVATLVNYRWTLQAGVLTDSGTASAALRN